MEISYQDINRKTIDRWVDDGWEWGKPISREVYAAAKNGQWDVKLTPVKFVPHGWFGDLNDSRVLGLAAGAGLAVLEFFLRPTLLNVKDVEDVLKLETLGRIPKDTSYFQKNMKR